MHKEGRIPSEVYFISGLILLGALSLSGVSPGTRDIVRRRDKVCVETGAIDRLEVAHIDHTRNRRYDDPSNSRLLTAPRHYMDHINRHGRNGLTKHANYEALKMIWDRLTSEEQSTYPRPSSVLDLDF